MRLSGGTYKLRGNGDRMVRNDRRQENVWRSATVRYRREQKNGRRQGAEEVLGGGQEVIPYTYRSMSAFAPAALDVNALPAVHEAELLLRTAQQLRLEVHKEA